MGYFRAGWRARREAGVLGRHGGSNIFLVASVFAASRGYFTYGWWYPPLMLVGGAALAWITTGWLLHRLRKQQEAERKAERKRHVHL